jgi:hypothetical protein
MTAIPHAVEFEEPECEERHVHFSDRMCLQGYEPTPDAALSSPNSGETIQFTSNDRAVRRRKRSRDLVVMYSFPPDVWFRCSVA